MLMLAVCDMGLMKAFECCCWWLWFIWCKKLSGDKLRLDGGEMFVEETPDDDDWLPLPLQQCESPLWALNDDTDEVDSLRDDDVVEERLAAMSRLVFDVFTRHMDCSVLRLEAAAAAAAIVAASNIIGDVDLDTLFLTLPPFLRSIVVSCTKWHLGPYGQ